MSSCATPNSQIHLKYSSQFMTSLLGNATNLEEYFEKSLGIGDFEEMITKL